MTNQNTDNLDIVVDYISKHFLDDHQTRVITKSYQGDQFFGMTAQMFLRYTKRCLEKIKNEDTDYYLYVCQTIHYIQKNKLRVLNDFCSVEDAEFKVYFNNKCEMVFVNADSYLC
jgi:hypothetical protein